MRILILAALSWQITQPVLASAPRIEQGQVVAAPIDRVFRAFTTTDGLRSFAASEVRVEARIGGAYEWFLTPGAPNGSRGTEGATIVALLEPELLVVAFPPPPSAPGLRAAGERFQVVMKFDALAPDATYVRFVADGFGEGSEWITTAEWFAATCQQLGRSLGGRFPDAVVEVGPLRVAGVVEVATERVFADLTTEEGLEKWLAPQVAVDLRQGGLIQHRAELGSFAAEDTEALEILAFDPGRMLATRVVTAPRTLEQADALTRLTTVYYLEALGPERCHLTISIHGFLADAESRHLRRMLRSRARQLIETLAESHAPAPLPAGG
jgi:uncharacterized protein YndB with AHSA1/START domain